MKFAKLLALAAIMVALGFTGLTAGSPRSVLVEEYTNASCGPCAAYNPTYEEYMIPKAGENLIPISFHANFPGRDSMYDENVGMHLGRQSYIGVNGVPTIYVDGVIPPHFISGYWDGCPYDTTSIINSANAHLGSNSPYTVTVENAKQPTGAYTITVHVTSDNAVSAGTVYLKVVMAEAWHYYSDAGNNGEKNFYYVAREMFPDYKGTQLELNAHESKTFTFDYTPNSAYNGPLLYAVAFIQDDANKNVLQAATSGVPGEVSNSVSITKKYVKFSGSDPQTFEVNVTNPQSSKIESDLIASSIVMPAGWTASFSPSTVTVPANSSAKSTLTITPPAGASGFGWVNVTATPSPKYGIPKSASTYAGALSDKTKYLVTLGTDQMINYPLAVLSNYFGTADAVNIGIVPLYDADFQNIITFTDYKLIYLSFDYSTGSAIGATSVGNNLLVDNLDAYVKAGKGLFMTTEALSYYASQYGNIKIQNFLRNTLGLQYVTINGLVNNNTLVPFSITGTSDPISSGISATGNSVYSTSSYPFYCATVEIYNANSSFTGTATPLFTTTFNNQSYNLGYKIENKNQKAIVLGFGLQAFSTGSTVVAFTKNALDWLLTPAAVGDTPVIASEKSTYDFAHVEVNKNKTMTIKIQNTGKAALNVSTMSIEGDGASAFTLLTSSSDFAIDPGTSYSAIVKFAPTEQKTYTANFVVNSDASNATKFSIPLQGIGDPGQGVTDEISGDQSKLTLSVAPNPVSTNSNITFNVGGDIQKFVKLNIVDETGRVISTIFEGMAQSGKNIVNLNASALPSGKYFLIGEADGYQAQLSINVVK